MAGSETRMNPPRWDSLSAPTSRAPRRQAFGPGGALVFLSGRWALDAWRCACWSGTDILLHAKGYSQRGIAGKLDVSDNTVRTHMRNLYRKLQIHSRQDAIELVEGFGRGEGVRGLS